MTYTRVSHSSPLNDGSATDLTTVLNAHSTALEALETSAGVNVKNYGAKGDGTTDDTTAIQNALTAAAGSTVHGVPGQAYIISAPIIIQSNTTLDMTGCTVTLKTGSNCNMVQNAAVTANTRITNAAMTAASAVLTSTSSAFNSSMVGKAVTVQGAGASGVPLTTTVASYQTANQITLTATASTTVSGQYAAIGSRDSDIQIIGGTWDRGANGDTSVSGSSLRFRHVDRLTIQNTTHKQTAGKYNVNAGDCTKIRIDAINTVDCTSDAVHINGPASQITITRVMGISQGDDLVSFTARDSTAAMNDCAGDITDVFVSDCSFSLRQASLLFANCLKIVAGRTSDASNQYAVRRLSARNLSSPTAVVYLGDTSAGNFEDITVENLRCLGNQGYGGAGSAVLIKGGTSVDKIRIRNVNMEPSDANAVAIDATVNRIHISGINNSATSASPNGVLVSSGTTSRLSVTDSFYSSPAGALVRINSGATVTQAIMSNNEIDGGATSMQTPAGAALGSIHISGLISSSSAYPLGIYNSSTNLTANGVHATGATAWLWVQGSGAVNAIDVTGLSGNIDTYLGAVTPIKRSSILSIDNNALLAGTETFPRLLAQTNASLATQRLFLTYFTAVRSETITQARTFTSGTAAVSTTLARIGLYTVDASGNLALVASCASDTALWNATFGTYAKAFSSSYSLIAGQRYALGILWVGTTAPKLLCALATTGGELALAPRLAGNVDSQADLPSSITAGTVVNTGGTPIYSSLIP